MTPNEFVKFVIAQGDEEEREWYLFQKIMEKVHDVDLSFHPSTDYLETFYEVVARFYSDEGSEFLLNIENTKGRGGMWELAKQLTDEFHAKYEYMLWGEKLDWHDTLEQFLTEKIK